MKPDSMKPNLILLTLIACLVQYTGCKKASPVYVAAPPAITIADILKASPSFSLFHEAVLRSGTDSLLRGPGPFTLLLPDNNAFAETGIQTTAQIDSLDTAYLRQLVLYSTVPKALLSTDIPVALQTPYLNLLGDTLYFSQPIPGSPDYSGSLSNYDQLHVNGDTLLSLDTKASNGYIEILSSPLKVPAPSVQALLAADTNYSWFVTGLRNFGLYDQLTGPGPFTVIAPSNAAWLQWGITLDSINRMDTVHFKKYLFGVSILNPHRIFLSDFRDGPVSAGLDVNVNYPHYSYIVVRVAFFSPDGIFCNQSLDDNTSMVGAFFVTLDPAAYIDGYSGRTTYYFLGPLSWPDGVDRVEVFDRDRIARNGVVHGINNILIFPDSVRIQ